MKTKAILIIALLCAFAGMANTTRAASRTVTYMIKAEKVSGYTNRYTFTFEKTSGSTFGYSTGEKTATVTDVSATTGFYVNLDDGLRLHLSMSSGQLAMRGGSGGYCGLYLNSGLNAALTLASTHYCVTHVKMADLDGVPLFATATPWTGSNAQMDVDVDMVTESDDLGVYRAFSARFASTQIFGQITITYGDPREYAITFDDVEGLSNPNPASYNVTTNTFDITAPSRTGYTLASTTYTDGLHPYATAVDLSATPLSIERGDAVQRKAITFNTTWTAHHYTVHYDANGGGGTMEDQAFTYDEGVLTANAFTAPTGYTFAGWSTTQNGSVEYTDQQATPNVTGIAGATVTLYAKWTPITYTVRFNKNGGSGVMAEQTLTYDMPANLTANTFSPSRVAYSFTGWNTRTDVSGDAFTDGQEVVNLSSTQDAIVTLFAQWTPDLATYWHADANHDGTTAERAYIISNTTGLQLLADRVNGKNGALQNNCEGLFFVLDQDIDFNGVSFYGIGGSKEFRGTFDGHGHTISNVLIDNYGTNGGLFGYVVYGNVRRVVLNGAIVNSYSITNYGAIVGFLDEGTVEDCLVLGCTVSAGYYTGAIVGQATNSSTLSGNYYHGCTISGTANATNVGVGRFYAAGNETSGDLAGQAQAVFTLTVPSGINVTATPTVSHAGTNYYTEGTSVTLASATSGLTLSNVQVNGSSTGVTDNGNGTFSFAMPAADATVTASLSMGSISYIDENGLEQTCSDYTLIDGNENDENIKYTASGWYVVNGNVSVKNLDFNLSSGGTVNLILCDGAKLTIGDGNDEGLLQLSSQRASTLSIYGQEAGSGSLEAYRIDLGYNADYNLNLNGGTINACLCLTASEYSDPITSGITIRRGTVNAIATNGRGIDIYYGNLTISGGTVTARSESSNAIYVYEANITISGGTVTATSTGGYAIGADGNLTISGGSVTAETSANYYYGLVASHDLTISGGNVTARATGGDASYGMCADYNITLGCSSANDCIYSSSYFSNFGITIASGQTLTDGTAIYSGTLDNSQIAAIAGQTLRPVASSEEATMPLTAHYANWGNMQYYWTTFYHPIWNYKLPAGAQAFILKSDKALYRVGDGTIVPAGCAVVIMADRSSITSDSTFPQTGTLILTATTDAAPTVSGNILLGTSVETSRSNLAQGSLIYVFGKDSFGVGFFGFTGSMVPANKAYYVQ